MSVNLPESGKGIFQPFVEIHYSESAEGVLVQTYSIDGRVHTSPPKRLKHSHLPTLLFQLADRGYAIFPEPIKFNVRVLRAYSAEYRQRVDTESGAKK